MDDFGDIRDFIRHHAGDVDKARPDRDMFQFHYVNDVPRLLTEVDRLLSYRTRADALSNPYTPESVSDEEIDLDDWGAWRYDQEENTLFLNPQRMPHLDPTYCRSYAIRLDECGRSAGILDWIFHVAGKDWCTPGVLASLIEALDTLINRRPICAAFARISPWMMCGRRSA